MKQWYVLIVFFLLSGHVLAQKYQYRAPSKIQNTANLANKLNLQYLSADLTMVDWAYHGTYPGTSARAVKVYVKNMGKLQTAPSFLKVVFSWRVDHEAFTRRELEYFLAVPALSNNQSQAVWVKIPDNKISSNKGFGSSHVSIRIEADATNKIAESNESNNRLYTSAPILHD